MTPSARSSVAHATGSSAGRATAVGDRRASAAPPAGRPPLGRFSAAPVAGCTRRPPRGGGRTGSSPRPKRMSTHLAEIGKKPGDAVRAAQDPAEERALQDDRARRGRRRRPRWQRPATVPAAERHHEHEPEQRGEGREVGAVVDVLLLHGQQRAAEAGDERRRWRRPAGGPGRARCRSTAAPTSLPRSARERPAEGARAELDDHDADDHEHDHGEHEERLVVSRSNGPMTGPGDLGALAAATCRRRRRRAASPRPRRRSRRRPAWRWRSTRRRGGGWAARAAAPTAAGDHAADERRPASTAMS